MEQHPAARPPATSQAYEERRAMHRRALRRAFGHHYPLRALRAAAGGRA